MISQKRIYLKKGVLLLSLFLLLIGAALAILLIAELALRLFYPASPRPHWLSSSVQGSIFKLDKELIYSMRPNAYRIWETDDFIERIQTNSLGLRSEEIAEKKEKFRILVLGDSYTFGHGVETEQSYPKQLGKLMSDSLGKEVEVINAGVKGYDLDQEYWFLTTRLLELEPDIVIITLGKGDFWWTCERPLYDLVDGELIPLDATKTWLYLQTNLYTKAPPWMRQSHLFLYLLQSLRGRNLFGISLQKEGKNWQKKCPDWSYKKALKQLAELKKMGTQRSFQLLVVFAPILYGEDYDFQYQEKFEDMLKVNDYIFIDASRGKYWPPGEEAVILGVEAINWEALCFEHDAHLVPEGNKVFAQIVMTGMLEAGLIK